MARSTASFLKRIRVYPILEITVTPKRVAVFLYSVLKMVSFYMQERLAYDQLPGEERSEYENY